MSLQTPEAIGLLVVLGVLGLAIGSFLNVVIWRVPRGESVVRPPSACPGCGAPIRRRDNIPVLSWLLLRGRCRDCGGAVSPRYLVVEALTATLFVLVGAMFLEQPWALPAYLYLASIGVALALIDVDTHRLPDVIVLPSYVVVPILLVVASAPDGDWGALLRAGVAGAALWLAYAVMWFAYPSGMGFGDVKLAGVLGMLLGWLGWGALVVGAFGAFLVGGIFALGLLILRRAGRKSGIPFGPWMLIGAGLGITWGEQVWDAYLRASGLA